MTRRAMGQLKEGLDALVADGATPGYAAFVRVGAETSQLIGGALEKASRSPAPDPSTVYDVASLTKVLATWGARWDGCSRIG